MSYTVSVILAWHPDSDRSRHPGFALAKAYWREMFPVWELLIPPTTTSVDHYNCGESKNQGARASSSDVLIFADADTLVEPAAALEAAWTAALAPGLVFSADRIRALSFVETACCATWRQALELEPGDSRPRPTDSASGLIAIRRDCFEQVGGFDPRYRGYGFEDLAFHRECRLRWPTRYVGATMVHLWHYPAQAKTQRDGHFQINQRLFEEGSNALTR